MHSKCCGEISLNIVRLIFCSITFVVLDFTCPCRGPPQCYVCNETSEADCKRTEVLQTCPNKNVSATVYGLPPVVFSGGSLKALEVDLLASIAAMFETCCGESVQSISNASGVCSPSGAGDKLSFINNRYLHG